MSRMTTFPQRFDVRVKRPVPDKAIFWPTAIGYGDQPQLNADSTRFPGLTAIKARNSVRPAAPLAEFVKAAGEAQDRILILDEYLFKPPEGTFQIRVKQVLSWFSNSLRASDVRILTSSVIDFNVEYIIKQFEERAAEINSGIYSSGVKIQVRFTLKKNFPYIHDRFAIIDDELWHFGATVGGLHEHVNAATRGWVVDDHNGLAFFETAWTGDPDMGHSFSKPTRQR
jgi:hypothetical protein